MSEAETPNNQPLPEPTASMDDSATDLPDTTETSEEPQIVNVSVLPDLQDVAQESRQEQTTEPISAITVSSTTLEADDRTTEKLDAFRQQQTHDADWFALAQKMRQRNRRLLEQVNQLKQALEEKQEALHSEQMRSREREILLAQQAEEVHTVQEQLGRLFQALEASHQASQRQQILIETLSEQLQNGQERVAQLERECALTQQRYNEQSHQLLQAANTCRELRTRLHRQQRQTLQFKVALEKSLEMPSTNSGSQQQPYQRSGTVYPPGVSKAQPIKPWSADPELVEDSSDDFDTIWNRPVQLEPHSALYSSQAEPFDIRRIEETDLLSTAEPSDSEETAIANRDSVNVQPFGYDNILARRSPEVPLLGGSKLPEALDIAPLASSLESAATELELEQQLLAEMTSLAEASGLSEFHSDLADAQAELTSERGTSADEPDAPEQYLSDAEETRLPEDTEELDPDEQIFSEELWGEAPTRKPEQPNQVVLPQSNWPSPVLYPLRSPKKRKSLAAIDLPSFPRYRPI